MAERIVNDVITKDILVIGGAGAGVMSAVQAVKSGASVALVTKGKVGKSGNTIMIGGGFSIDGESARDICGYADANTSYTREKVFEKLVTSGFYLGDQRLQRIFALESGYAVKECLDWAREAKQLFAFNPRGNGWMTSGASFGKAVLEGTKQNPSIAVYEDVWIVELLQSNGVVCGALGIDIYTGGFIQYNAKAVVLATGGFQPFSLKNTHADMSGDGIGLALRAGARAVDMEFLLFIGTIIEPQYAKGSILPFLMSIQAMFQLRPKMTDLDGRELVFPTDARYKVGPTTGKVNKLLMADFYGRGIFEKFDAYGAAFYYDYSAYSDDEIRDAFEAMVKLEKTWHREGFYNGIDLQRLGDDMIKNGKRLKVGFGNEYSMGGVVVNPDFSTDVAGLFAAGEVTGGTFGAFRSGDGLTEMLVHGYTAGASAAEYAKGHDLQIPDNLQKAVEAVLAPLERADGTSAVDLRKELERICDEGFNFFRDGQRLDKGYREITNLNERLASLSVFTKERKYNLEWLDAFALRNLALCAQIGIYAALNRRESRGTHLRADYPEVNNQEYLFSYVARLGEGGRPEYEKKVPDAPYIPLHTENFPSVSDFLADVVLGAQ